MKPSEILRKGLEFLETKGWTQGSYARNAAGDAVDDLVDVACACGVGSIRLVTCGTVCITKKNLDLTGYSLARGFLNDVLTTTEGRISFAVWQDQSGRTFPEVQAKFHEAIALAEANELKVAA